MGDKTVAMFSNDFTTDLTEQPLVLTEIIKNHLLSGGETTSNPGVNGLKLFSPINTHDESLYLMHGGDLMEMSPYSEETAKLLNENPQYMKEAIESIQNQLDQLKEYFNNPDSFMGY